MEQPQNIPVDRPTPQPVKPVRHTRTHSWFALWVWSSWAVGWVWHNLSCDCTEIRSRN